MMPASKTKDDPGAARDRGIEEALS